MGEFNADNTAAPPMVCKTAYIIPFAISSGVAFASALPNKEAVACTR
jgi:hypothetical protein